MEKKLESYGWYFKRHGENHDVWTNGDKIELVPRHREIDKRLARKILKTAQKAFRIGESYDYSRNDMEKP